MTQPPTGKCSQPGCSFSVDGKCKQGLVPNECPEFRSDGVSKANGAAVGPASLEPHSETKSLSDGLELRASAASVISRAALTRVILLAGEPDSGKTTLLASIYQKLNEGSMAGYVFAGSSTLFAWERRCHLSRIACGRSKPDTERTLNTDCAFLHLRLRISDLNKPAQDVLFTDISGETFRNIRDSSDECQKLTVLRRADHFILALDGRKLTDLGLRQEAHHSGALLLRSCLDAQMLGRKSYVDVLFTKYDIIAEALADSETKRFLDYVQENLKERFEGRLARLRFLFVAARPEKSAMEPGYGLEGCLPSWVEESSLYGCRQAYQPGQVVLEREFDKYLERGFPQFYSGD